MGHASGRVAAMRLLKRAAHQPPRDPSHHPDLVRLAAEFQALRKRLAVMGVAAVARMGEILLEARAIARHFYADWRMKLGATRTTCQRCVRLARFQASEPRLAARLRLLGVSKLDSIARLTPQGRRGLIASHSIGELEQRSVHSFARLIRKYRPARRPVPAGLRAFALYRKAEAWGRVLRAQTFPRLENRALGERIRAQLGRLEIQLRRIRKAL